MLQNLSIQNCQSHKNTGLEFHPGVNVIVGLSDAGKSAIMNTLYWIIRNRPMGDDYLSFWGGEMKAEMKIDDTKISRIKSTSKNEYTVNATALKAFKTEVPPEVSQILNIDNINFKRQADDFFLLRNTAGEVASHFNRIAHLDKLDVGITNVKRWIHNLQVSIKSDQERAEELKKQLQEFEQLDKFEVQVEILERMHIDIIHHSNSIKQLDDLVEEIQKLEEEIEKQSEVLKFEEQVGSLLSMAKEKEQLQEDIDMLCKLKRGIESIDSEIVNSTAHAKGLEQKFKDKFPEVCPLCNQKVTK